jgi:hypothetical protein
MIVAAFRDASVALAFVTRRPWRNDTKGAGGLLRSHRPEGESAAGFPDSRARSHGRECLLLPRVAAYAAGVRLVKGKSCDEVVLRASVPNAESVRW